MRACGGLCLHAATHARRTAKRRSVRILQPYSTGPNPVPNLLQPEQGQPLHASDRRAGSGFQHPGAAAAAAAGAGGSGSGTGLPVSTPAAVAAAPAGSADPLAQAAAAVGLVQIKEAPWLAYSLIGLRCACVRACGCTHVCKGVWADGSCCM